MQPAMNPDVHSQPGAALNPVDFIRIVRTHVRWWAVPAIVCAVMAAAYSLLAPRDWRATQALIIRPEAASVSDERPGKFSDLSEMKTLQETILELAKSQSVVQATLKEVGPPRRYRHPQLWPTPLDVEAFRECIDMRPPGGAEFGKTEVFYLSVRDTNRDRASAFAAALCGQLEQRMQEIRDQRARGMVAELERTVAMATDDLFNVTQQLAKFEANIGSDLAELRNLNADVGGSVGVSQEIQAIEAERRANESFRSQNERLLRLLLAAQDDTQQLLATPNSLLKSQPAVSQLKSALVKAQIETVSLLGSRSENHPFVVAAREAELLLRDQLHDEVAVAIRGLEVDIELNDERERALTTKLEAARGRIARLAEARSEYANLVASVANHTRLVEGARANLADARARRAGALSASVISRIDGVEAGVRPVGPSRKTVTAAGGFGGLILGLGLVFLFGQPTAPAVVSRVVHAVPDNNHTAPAVGPKSANEQYATGTASKHSDTTFDMFTGMTLEEAIRSAEKSN